MQNLSKLEADYSVEPSFEVARAMIDLRISGGPIAAGGGAPTVTEEHDHRFDGLEHLPEIGLEHLDVGSLRAGILGKGALIVRNFMADDTVKFLREHIDNSLRSPNRLGQECPDGDPHDPWFCCSPMIAGGAPGPARVRGGDLSSTSGSLWTVDAPVAAAELVAFYKQVGLHRLLQTYFQEQALLSVRKWVLRCVPPIRGGNKGWHQDGRFMGAGIRTVNLWIALTDCGTGMPAPGLELVADSRRVIHETGTHGAFFDWTVGPDLVAKLSQERPVVCPTFRAGDAILFDHFSLHRTGEGPHDTEPRYAVESWFFAASTAPTKQQPLLF